MILTLSHYLILGMVLFCVGVFLVLSKKNAIMMLVGIELIFNAANLNFIAFNRYLSPKLDGIVFTLFVMVIAAVETVVALAILIQIYQRHKTIDIDQVS